MLLNVKPALPSSRRVCGIHFSSTLVWSSEVISTMLGWSPTVTPDVAGGGVVRGVGAGSSSWPSVQPDNTSPDTSRTRRASAGGRDTSRTLTLQ